MFQRGLEAQEGFSQGNVVGRASQAVGTAWAKAQRLENWSTSRLQHAVPFGFGGGKEDKEECSEQAHP